MEGVSNRYASALFSLALEEDKVLKYQQDLKLVNLVLENTELFNFFNHFKVEKNDKKELIKKALQKDIEINIINFLLLLIDKNRFNVVKTIISDFNSLANKHNNVVEGLIYSSEKMEIKDIEKIQLALANKLKARVELTNKIDPSLIGGFKIVIGDTIYDSSLKSKLNSLKYELLEGKVNMDGN